MEFLHYHEVDAFTLITPIDDSGSFGIRKGDIVSTIPLPSDAPPFDFMTLEEGYPYLLSLSNDHLSGYQDRGSYVSCIREEDEIVFPANQKVYFLEGFKHGLVKSALRIIALLRKSEPTQLYVWEKNDKEFVFAFAGGENEPD